MRAGNGLALTLCIGKEGPMSKTASTASPTPPKIYKILTHDQWEDLCRDGTTWGSPLDVTDGFIHFSTPAQLSGTLSKHFAGAGPLTLAEVPLTALSDHDVRWEAARNGDLFPHLYGALRQTQVSRHWPLHPNANGGYIVPERIGT